jgi:hypothetical protein
MSASDPKRRPPAHAMPYYKNQNAMKARAVT